MKNKIKIIFELIVDENGYPPFGSEVLWGTKTGHKDQYVIDNIPFYTSMVSLGDVVVVKKQDSFFAFEKVILTSGNSTIRVYCTNDSLLSDLKKRLTDRGCSLEVSNINSLISVNIPPSVDINAIVDLIQLFKKKDSDIEYEDGCIQHSGYTG